MKRPEHIYVNYDMFADDKGGPPLRLNSVKLVKTRKEHECVFVKKHVIPVGSLVRFQQAIVDGEWRSFYCCLACMDRWFDEIDY